jgi:hypothetical protein
MDAPPSSCAVRSGAETVADLPESHALCSSARSFSGFAAAAVLMCTISAIGAKPSSWVTGFLRDDMATLLSKKANIFYMYMHLSRRKKPTFAASATHIASRSQPDASLLAAR